jgi:glucosylceramidase
MNIEHLSAEQTTETHSPADIDPLGWARGSEQPAQDPNTIHLTVLPDLEHQTLSGIGGSFSELGADALGMLPEEEKARALGALFGAEGAALTWGRVPIGASDFARSDYSHSETPEDFELRHFSISRDESGLLPFVRAARALQPALRLHASPWSPPGWMKDNGRMTNGGSLRPECMEVYARYLARFARDYAATGAPIERILPQNEPDVPTPYPSCVMLPAQMVEFVVRHLAPALRDSGTEVWGGTFRMVGGLQGHECLSDPAFRAAVGGVGYQYSFYDTLAGLRLLFPGLRVMHTESVCHNGANSWKQAALLFEDLIAYLRAGCETYTYWNMALNEDGRSSWGWKQNSLITVDRPSGTWHANPDLGVLSLFSKHILPGSVRVEAFSFQRPALAVKRPDGVLVAFVANHEPVAKPLKLHLGVRTMREELPPRSFAAITL